MKKLYLSEIIKNEGIILQRNKVNIIVAPAGSGKTFYIFKELLNPSKKTIYLCDTSNLKEAILKDSEYIDVTTSRRQNKLKEGFFLPKYNCTVMTYAEYGCYYEDYKDIDTIICDEIHNLYIYSDRFKTNGNYKTVIDILHQKARAGIKVIGFTATVDRIKTKEMRIFQQNLISYEDGYFNVIDVTEHKDINKLLHLNQSFFTDYSQTSSIFARTNIFKYEKKCLVYTDRISTAKEMCEYYKAMFKNVEPIALWSTKNEKYSMDEEQLRVRESILKDGIIPAPYNLLIINGSYETGINIKDNDIEMVICNTTNSDTIVQARSRVRKDIDWLLYRLNIDKEESKDNFIQQTIVVPDNYLDRPLTTKDKKDLIKHLGLKDIKGRQLGWTNFKLILDFNKYEVVNDGKRIRINKKLTRTSEIKDNLNTR